MFTNEVVFHDAPSSHDHLRGREGRRGGITLTCGSCSLDETTEGEREKQEEEFSGNLLDISCPGPLSHRDNNGAQGCKLELPEAL